MISDHVALTPDVEAHYPAPFYDPFLTLAWLASQTRTVELGTTVIILPYRHPLQVARLASNLDQLSGACDDTPEEQLHRCERLAGTLRRLGTAQLRDVPRSPDGGVIADFTGELDDPAELAERLSATVGVVEHGLVPAEMVSTLVVARGEQVEIRSLR